MDEVETLPLSLQMLVKVGEGWLVAVMRGKDLTLPLLSFAPVSNPVVRLI